jgi:hypothetical protein
MSLPRKFTDSPSYLKDIVWHRFPQIPKSSERHRQYRRLKKLILSSSYSIPQVIVAIVQMIYASYTLYNTRGDQLNRYGYAAFGFTVIPYVIMSFMNLLGNLLTPDYPTLYLVSSPELEEARSREDARIDGVVGKVSDGSWDVPGKRFTGQVHDIGAVDIEDVKGQFGLQLQRVHDDSKEPSSSQPRAHPVSNNPVSDSQAVPVNKTASPSSKTEQDTTRDGVVCWLCPISGHSSAGAKILFPVYTPFKPIDHASPYQGPTHSGFLWWGFTAVFLGAIPYAVIGGLTHFHAAQSTPAQRVLTMF